MTDRAAALRSLRGSRTEGLPPPPPLTPAPSPESPSRETVERPSTGPRRPRPQAHKPARKDPSGNATTSLDALLADPVTACREMGNRRENMPARPLNVDLTPGVARAFDEQCRALRVKKKDVVELLLRGWLEHQGQDLDE